MTYDYQITKHRNKNTKIFILKEGGTIDEFSTRINITTAAQLVEETMRALDAKPSWVDAMDWEGNILTGLEAALEWYDK